jgi:hypothetical protein
VLLHPFPEPQRPDHFLHEKSSVKGALHWASWSTLSCSCDLDLSSAGKGFAVYFVLN